MLETQRRIDLIAHADPEVRAAALALVDELTRPMDAREMEESLVRFYTRKKAREIVTALKFFEVVMLRPEPSVPTKHDRHRPVHGSTSPLRLGTSRAPRRCAGDAG